MMKRKRFSEERIVETLQVRSATRRSNSPTCERREQLIGHFGIMQLKDLRTIFCAMASHFFIPGVVVLIGLHLSFPTHARDAFPLGRPAERVSDERQENEPPPQQISTYVAFTATTLGGQYAEINLNFAPWGVYETGPRIRLVGSAYQYRYLVEDEDERSTGLGRGFETSLLAGYGIDLNNVYLTLLAGPTYSATRDESGSSSAWGLAAQISAYATPTDDTITYVSASYSSLTRNYELEGKFGFKVHDSFYIGPEVLLSGKALASDQMVSVQQYGLHLSRLSMGPGWFGMSAGVSNDAQLGVGGYFSVSFYCCRSRSDD